MLALTTGLIMSFCAITTRLLKEVPTPVVVFYHTLGGLIMSGLYILIEMAVTHSPCRFASYSASEMWTAIGASAFDCSALLNITAAYQADSSGFVSLLSYMNIVWAYVCDQVIFHEALNPVELVCALIILVVALGVAIYKLRQQRA